MHYPEDWYEDCHWWAFISVQQGFSKMFLLFQVPSENQSVKNDISFKSQIKEVSNFGEKMGTVPSYELPHPQTGCNKKWSF